MTKANNFKIEKNINIKLADILPNPWNPNKTTSRQQEAIAESLQYYGQVLDLLVRPHPEQKGKYQIIDGEHRFNALNGNEVVSATVIDLPDHEAKRLTVIMNETRGQADKIELADLLSSIESEFDGDLITGLPFTPDELEQLTSAGDFDWDAFENGDDEEPSLSDEGDTNDNEGDDIIEIVLSPVALEQLKKATKNPKPSKAPQIFGDYISELIVSC